MPHDPLPLAVLVSGAGSNLQALIDRPDAAYEIAVVISDRPSVGALDRAQDAGIPVEVIDWEEHRSRRTFTDEVCSVAARYGSRALVLAGFMRILAPEAIERFPDAIINVHPSLLPSFPGARAVEQALAFGVSYTGVTVHFIDEEVDHGPIIAQRPVPVHDGDNAEALHARIQRVEHELFPAVVDAFSRGEVTIVDGVSQWRTPSATGGAR